MYIQFNDELGFPKILKVKKLGTREEFGRDEQDNAIKLYCIVDESIYDFQNILSVAASDTMRR